MLNIARFKPLLNMSTILFRRFCISNNNNILNKKLIAEHPCFNKVKITDLNNIKGAYKKKKRLGRGRGSGRGKTSGRGHKGQGQRGTKPPVWFEGGQSPLNLRLPKFGMFKKRPFRMGLLNLSYVRYAKLRGWIDTSKPVTIRDLVKCGIVTKYTHGVKLLAKGKDKFDFKIDIEVSDASEEAIKHIKENGGSVIVKHRTRTQLRAHVHPEKYKFKLEETIPIKKQVLKLEKLRDLGCIVEYIKPKWAEDPELLEIIKKRKENSRLKKPVTLEEEPDPAKDPNIIYKKRRQKLVKEIKYNV